jgi:hypothetical protein
VAFVSTKSGWFSLPDHDTPTPAQIPETFRAIELSSN